MRFHRAYSAAPGPVSNGCASNTCSSPFFTQRVRPTCHQTVYAHIMVRMNVIHRVEGGCIALYIVYTGYKLYSYSIAVKLYRNPTCRFL